MSVQKAVRRKTMVVGSVGMVGGLLAWAWFGAA